MSETILLERTTAGFTVGVKWLPLTGTLVLQAILGDGDEWMRAVTIPDDKAFDAFDHPFSYLPDTPPGRW